MKKVIAGIATGLFLIVGAGIAQSAPLLNGDFDTVGDITGNVNGINLNTLTSWDVYDSLPGGWQKGAGTAGIEVQYSGVIGIAAHSGNYYIELDSDGGDNTNSSMFQEIWLDAGQYDLSFMYHARTDNLGDDNGIEGHLNGFGFGHISKTLSEVGSGWEQVNWTFTVASSGLQTLGFGAYGTDNSLGGFIDSVSLNAAPVPEPATMLLFGAGLAGLAGARLRRKK